MVTGTFVYLLSASLCLASCIDLQPVLPRFYSPCNAFCNLQAQAQYTHLNVTEQAIEQHAMALLYSDPNSSDHQRAHVGKALIDERELNDKAMKDVAAAIEVCQSGPLSFPHSP